MRRLPDNPNLDHLRQQAKDLLAGLRDTDPTATLAAAQASLARQYGFHSWPQLKTEAERRRGGGEVAEPALAEAIAETYDLGAAHQLRSVAPADDLGRQWCLETDRGRWAVRTMDGWIPMVDAERIVALQHAAAARGVALPAPVLSRSGTMVETIAGHRWRVTEWRHSGPPLVAPAGAAVTRHVGRVLALIHGAQLPATAISPWHASRLPGPGWDDLVARARLREAPWAELLDAAIPTLADLESIGEGGPAAAPVLCHNTLGPASTRRGAGGELVVVDWERAGGRSPGGELADALVHWCRDPDGGVNAGSARALVEGYRAEAGSLPSLDLAGFRDAAISTVNYVAEEVAGALADAADRSHADRSVRHALTHLPTRGQLVQLRDAAAGSLSGRPTS